MLPLIVADLSPSVRLTDTGAFWMVTSARSASGAAPIGPAIIIPRTLSTSVMSSDRPVSTTSILSPSISTSATDRPTRNWLTWKATVWALRPTAPALPGSTSMTISSLASLMSLDTLTTPWIVPSSATSSSVAEAMSS